MKEKSEYAYFAILRIYESDSEGLRDPVIKITHS